MNVDAETLCTTLLEQARRRGHLPKWIEIATTFIQRQDLALREAREGLRAQLGVRADRDRLAATLGDLVALKNLKDLIEQQLATCGDEIPVDVKAKMDEYDQRKPAAWKAAREALPR